MPPRIFISYRREDSGDYIKQIYDALVDKYGHDYVFYAKNNIKFGKDYESILEMGIDQCHILMPVIDDMWSTTLVERLKTELDWVRVEVMSAVRADKPVIPLVIGDAELYPIHPDDNKDNDDKDKKARQAKAYKTFNSRFQRRFGKVRSLRRDLEKFSKHQYHGLKKEKSEGVDLVELRNSMQPIFHAIESPDYNPDYATEFQLTTVKTLSPPYPQGLHFTPHSNRPDLSIGQYKTYIKLLGRVRNQRIVVGTIFLLLITIIFMIGISMGGGSPQIAYAIVGFVVLEVLLLMGLILTHRKQSMGKLKLYQREGAIRKGVFTYKIGGVPIIMKRTSAFYSHIKKHQDERNQRFIAHCLNIMGNQYVLGLQPQLDNRPFPQEFFDHVKQAVAEQETKKPLPLPSNVPANTQSVGQTQIVPPVKEAIEVAHDDDTQPIRPVTEQQLQSSPNNTQPEHLLETKPSIPTVQISQGQASHLSDEKPNLQQDSVLHNQVSNEVNNSQTLRERGAELTDDARKFIGATIQNLLSISLTGDTDKDNSVDLSDAKDSVTNGTQDAGAKASKGLQNIAKRRKNIQFSRPSLSRFRSNSDEETS